MEKEKKFLVSIRYIHFNSEWREEIVSKEPLSIKDSFEEASITVWKKKEEIISSQKIKGVEGVVEEVPNSEFLRFYPQEFIECGIDKICFDIESVPYEY